MAKSSKLAEIEAQALVQGQEEYQALYRRFRPHLFQDVIGQRHITEPLRRAVVESKIPHAHLFTGPRGCGKTTTARILAQALNCSQIGEDGEPCNNCTACLAVQTGDTGIGIENLDGASVGSVDSIRGIIERAQIASPLTKNKVFIIDEVHALSAAAAQALLLILEEPPPNVYFILCTTEAHRMIPTIQSRVTRWDFKLLGPDTIEPLIEGILKQEGGDLDADAISDVIAEGAGSPRDTLSVLERVLKGGSVGSEDRSGDIMDALDSENGDPISSTYLVIASAVDDGASPQALLHDLSIYLRNAILSLHAPDLLSVSHSQRERIAAHAQSMKLTRLNSLIRLLGETSWQMSKGSDPRFLLESTLIHFLQKERHRSDSFEGVHSRFDEILDELDELRATVDSLLNNGVKVSSSSKVSNDSDLDEEEDSDESQEIWTSDSKTNKEDWPSASSDEDDEDDGEDEDSDETDSVQSNKRDVDSRNDDSSEDGDFEAAFETLVGELYEILPKRLASDFNLRAKIHEESEGDVLVIDATKFKAKLSDEELGSITKLARKICKPHGVRTVEIEEG